MFGIIFSALNAFAGPLLAFLLRGAFIKWVIGFALYAIVALVAGVLSGLLPSASSLQNIFGTIPNYFAYFLAKFGIYQGVGMVFSAYATRFIIRRIPFIG